jgi:hypothetical protein
VRVCDLVEVEDEGGQIGYGISNTLDAYRLTHMLAIDETQLHSSVAGSLKLKKPVNGGSFVKQKS